MVKNPQQPNLNNISSSDNHNNVYAHTLLEAAAAGSISFVMCVALSPRIWPDKRKTSMSPERERGRLRFRSDTRVCVCHHVEATARRVVRCIDSSCTTFPPRKISKSRVNLKRFFLSFRSRSFFIPRQTSFQVRGGVQRRRDQREGAQQHEQAHSRSERVSVYFQIKVYVFSLHVLCSHLSFVSLISPPSPPERLLSLSLFPPFLRPT